jgi:hypothetical protein
MSLFDNFFKGKEGGWERNEYGTLNPEQVKMYQAWAPTVTAQAGKELPMYGSTWQDYTAPMGQSEKDMVARNARMSALGEQGLSSLLKGEFPEQYYRDTIYQPALKNWQEDILPQISESYAGPNGGGFYGSARGNAVTRNARDLSSSLAAQRAQLAWNVQQNVPNAVAAANSLSQTESNIQSMPRLIQDYGMQKLYDEWVRTRPENSPYLNAALNFLNLSTVTERYRPTQLSQSQAATRGLGVGGMTADMIAGNGDYSATEAAGARAANMADTWGNYMMSQMPSQQQSTNMMSAMKGGGQNSAPTPSYQNQTQSQYQSPQYYTQAQGGLGAANNAYNQSSLGAMDWRNTGNYQALGGYSY